MMQALKNRLTNDEKTRVINIPTENIYPNPNQPRRYFNEASLEELSDSIAMYGVIQPITVRRVEKGYELISGERRLRASMMANLETIPAIVVNADTEKSAVFALLENLQREDLCFFEIAEAYRALIEEHNMTQDELAKKMGKSQSTIANKLRILRLTPKVRRLIDEYSLTERHARAILQIPDEALQIETLNVIFNRHLNVVQSEEYITALLNEKPKKKKKILYPRIKDLRLFTNTVKNALDTVRRNGLEADMVKNDFDWGYEYIIKIKNSENIGNIGNIGTHLNAVSEN